MKQMEPIKLIPNRADDFGKHEGYGIIMSDGKNAEIYYFDRYGNPQNSTIQYCRRVYDSHCKKNNLKQL